MKKREKMKNKLIEIRIHGRGGQGAMTSSQILAMAAFYDGKYSQAFPIPGTERGGAPVSAYVRISNEPINLRSEIYNPDYVIVLDSSLLKVIDVREGLKKDLIINTKKKIEKAKCVDATEIAFDIIGKPFVNIIMVSAFAACTNLISLKSILKAIEDKFEEDKPEMVEKNKKAVRKIYEKIKNK